MTIEEIKFQYALALHQIILGILFGLMVAVLFNDKLDGNFRFLAYVGSGILGMYLTYDFDKNIENLQLELTGKAPKNTGIIRILEDIVGLIRRDYVCSELNKRWLLLIGFLVGLLLLGWIAIGLMIGLARPEDALVVNYATGIIGSIIVAFAMLFYQHHILNYKPKEKSSD